MRTFSDRPKEGLPTGCLSASGTTVSQGLTDPEDVTQWQTPFEICIQYL